MPLLFFEKQFFLKGDIKTENETKHTRLYHLPQHAIDSSLPAKLEAQL